MVVAMLASMTLTIAPWTLRNYLVTGHFVPISTGLSDAFLRGYVFSKTQYITLRQPPYTDGENESNEMFRRICAAEGAVWEQDDYQTDQILNRAAKERLLASPGAFARKTLVGVVTFWYEMTTLKTSLFVGAMALTAWLFAAVGLWKSRTERQPVWLLLLPILYFNLLLAPLLALGRYSVPVLALPDDLGGLRARYDLAAAGEHLARSKVERARSSLLSRLKSARLTKAVSAWRFPRATREA